MEVTRLILLLVFLVILYQDVKERMVYWFLFPLVALVSGILFYNSTLPELFVVSVLTNLLVVVFLLIVVYVYARFKLKESFNKVFGLGDVLLFLALAFSFSSVSYIVILVFSILFSLVLHQILNFKLKEPTVPLAGYMGLFFMLVHVSYWIGITENLYNL